MSASSVLAAAVLAAAAPSLDATFIGTIDGRPLALVVRVDNDEHGGRTRRLAAIAAMGDVGFTVDASDELGVPGSLLPLPTAPSGSSVVSDGGALLFTLPLPADAPPLPTPPDVRPPRGAAPALPALPALPTVDGTMRLAIYDDGTAQLTVGGRSIVGRGAVRRAHSSPWVVVAPALPPNGGVASLATLWSGEPSVVDVVEDAACGALPTAWSSTSPPLRLARTGTARCTARLALVPAAGTLLGKRDTAVQGVVVVARR